MQLTIQRIIDARPDIGIELLPADTRLVREDSGYSVEMKGYYSVPELLAITRDIERLNTVFAERPENTIYNVVDTRTGEVFGEYGIKREAEEARNRLEFAESHEGSEDFFKIIPTK